MDITLAKISEMVAGELCGDPEKIVRNAVPFENATGDDITYAGDAGYLKNLGSSAAGAVIVPEGVSADRTDIIRVKNPQVAFVRVLNLFYPPLRKEPGIHSPHIGGDFKAGREVSIAATAVAGNHVTLGDRVTLHPNVVLGDKVVIGNDVEIYPNVTVLDRCRIGSRVKIHAGTVIGSDGFGFASDGKVYHKIPHTGFVQIDDDVEIGAGNAIDRGTFGRTWIQRGVKTDNLVHIAHNVCVGEHTVIVAQVGISGSVTVGRHVILAGQAGVAGHIKIGDGAIVGPQAGIAKSVADGQVVSGSPEMPHRVWLRVQRDLPKLPELKKRIDALEKKLAEIEKR